MKFHIPVRATEWRRLALLLTVVVVGLTAILVARPGRGHPERGTSAPSPSITTQERTASTSPTVEAGGPSTPAAEDGQRRPVKLPRLDERGGTSDAATVFDESTPTIANLKPDLRDAFRRAAAAAQRAGVTFYVTSGWRSAAHQQELLNRAIAEDGSEAEALKWVATPQTSLHVKGEAVDIGHSTAIAWLAKHGAAYNLCQIYRNEPWHYELRPGAADQGCPAMYADPTHDPRMRK